MKRMMIRTWCLILAVLSAVPLYAQETDINAWQQKINDEILSTTQFPLQAVPGLGLLICYDSRFDESLTLLYPATQKIWHVGKKGVGPEEFQFYRMFDAVNGQLACWDSIHSRFHLYNIKEGRVQQVIDTKSWRKKLGFPLRVIGPVKDKWLVRWESEPDEKENALDMVMNTQVNYSVVNMQGEKSDNSFQIANDAELMIYSSIGTKEEVVHKADHDILIIQNPADFRTDSMILRVIKLPGWDEQIVHLKIPVAFSRLGEDGFAKVTSENMGFLFAGPDDHVPRPKLSRVGLDGRVYYIFTGDETDGKVETLINILDPATMRTDQYVYYGSVIPYLFAHDMVYCSNLADDAIKVLPVGDVLNEKNRFQPE